MTEGRPGGRSASIRVIFGLGRTTLLCRCHATVENDPGIGHLHDHADLSGP